MDYFNRDEISGLVQHGYCVARDALRRHLREVLKGGEDTPWDPFATDSDAPNLRGPKAAKRIESGRERRWRLFFWRDLLSWVHAVMLVLVVIGFVYFGVPSLLSSLLSYKEAKEEAKEKVEVQVRTYDLHWCGRPGCAPDNKQLMWNIDPKSPSCTRIDFKSQLKDNEELLLDAPAKLKPTRQIGTLPWHTVHPTELGTADKTIMQLCGYRDGPFDTWEKSEFQLKLTYYVLVRN